MTKEEFKKEVAELGKLDYNAIDYRWHEHINADDGIIPRVFYNVNAIRGYVSYEDALKFYKEQRESLKHSGLFWKNQFRWYLREKTGCGLGDAKIYIDELIEAISHKPKAVMDKPLKMKITWE